MPTVSFWQADGTQPVRHADVVVIGAGLLGCTAAVFLKQAGRDVLLVDALDVGLGASSRNAGFMLTGLEVYYHRAEEKYGETAAREIWQLSQKTHEFWRGIAHKHAVWMENCASLLLAESAEEARDLEQAARRMDAEGFACEFLPSDPLRRGYHAALRQPHDGGIQPYALTRALFEESGAELLGQSAVYALEADKNEVIVCSRRAVVRARQVMICTNGYSANLDPYFQGKVIPIRAQCLATAPVPERLVNAVGYSDYGYMYYRDLPDGGLLVGGGRKQNQQIENNTMEDRISAPVQSVLDAYLRRYFPEAASVPVVRRWAGIMGYTADGLPLVGRLPHDHRVVFAVGLNGHGLSLGAAVAERAVDLLLSATNPGVFDANRLG